MTALCPASCMSHIDVNQTHMGRGPMYNGARLIRVFDVPEYSGRTPVNMSHPPRRSGVKVKPLPVELDGLACERDERELFASLSLRLEPGEVLQVARSEEHTSELQSRPHLVCRLLLEKKKPCVPPSKSRTRSRPQPGSARIYGENDCGNCTIPAATTARITRRGFPHPLSLCASACVVC